MVVAPASAVPPAAPARADAAPQDFYGPLFEAVQLERAFPDSKTSYPYYDISWFDGVGRSYYLQLTYKFGGKL